MWIQKPGDGAIKNGNYEIVLNGHGGWGGDPDILRTTFANGRIRGYSNDEINELSERQLYEMDVKKRKDIIYKLQEVEGKKFQCCHCTTLQDTAYSGILNMMVGSICLTIMK